MPVIRFRVKDLERLGKVPRSKLPDLIRDMGASVEESKGEEWAVECFPNRPDLVSVEGLARAVRAYHKASGLAAYKVLPAKEQVRVDASIKGVRPVLRAAVVTGLTFDDAAIQGIMELQEDLHWGVGARRRKASIGMHDKAHLVGPYTYKAVGLDDVSFVPLQGTEPMTPRDVLAKHPKGTAYAHLVGERAPLLVDSQDQVLSFPPIINGTKTTVTEQTNEVLVDVTGLEERAVGKALNIVVTHLAEMGGKVHAVSVVEGKAKRISPDLAPEAWSVSPTRANTLLGLELTPAQMVKALQRMGHGAKVSKGRLAVQVPAYRNDVLHEVDLIEDVAIGHGYANFPYEKPRAVTYGQPLPVEGHAARAREVLLGLGFTEVMTLSLVSEPRDFHALGVPEQPHVRVRNPITEEHTMVRTSLLGSLLATLEKNVHRDYPQQVFEVGDVVHVHQALPANVRSVALVKAHSKAGFSEAKSIAMALVRDLRLDAEVQPFDTGACIPGRSAALVAADRAAGGLDKGVVGWFGELHPRTLEAFRIGQPAIALELRLSTTPLREA